MKNATSDAYGMLRAQSGQVIVRDSDNHREVSLVQANRLSARVVVAEPFSETGLAVLREHGIEIVSCVGKSRDELCEALARADGLIVRSETRVDRELLAAGPHLAVVARAGVGVDAIDVAAATDAGIVVLNTPGANTIAATELTFALLLALVRRIPDAVASTRAGRWERNALVGTELAGKTLGVVGLGRIGGAVAARAAAFGMRVVGWDPFISAARADALGAKLVALEELLGESDVVTLHVPLTHQTTGMIDADKLALMKPTAYLINSARGGAVDEAALLAALDGGKIAGAALDVVEQEPPQPGSTGARLHRHPSVIATPHLGGSTREAAERIATELARDLASVLIGGTAAGAVNAPVPDGPDGELLRPFVDLAHRLGRLYPQLAEAAALPPFAIALEGQIARLDSAPLVNAFLTGLLQATTDRRVSIVNARAIADELGIRVDPHGGERRGPFASVLRVTGGATTLAGTIGASGPRIVEVDGFEMDAIPSGSLLLTRHPDVPGMIGKVGTILGEAQINISTMQVSRENAGGEAIMVLATDRPADSATLERLRAVPGVHSVTSLTLE
jgi:D-3-phosphoglycerate dehydrogenase / 2-oxoglutarate reductase